MNRNGLRQLLLCGVVIWATFLSAQAQDVSSQQAEAPLRPTGYAVDYYDGLRAWDAGYKDVAMKLWLQAAEYGDAQSLRTVGDAYWFGGRQLPQSYVLGAYYRYLANSVWRTQNSGTLTTADPLLGLNEEERSAVLDMAVRWAPAGQGVTIEYPFEVVARAAQTGDIETIRASYAQDPMQWRHIGENGWNILHYAALGNQTEVVAFILDDGRLSEDVTTTDGGYSPLHIASLAGAAEVVELLLASRSLSLGQTYVGMPAADIAGAAGHYDLAGRLDDAARDEVRRVQAALNQQGFDAGAPDGMFGPRSRAALDSYLAATFNVVSGRVDQVELNYLLSR